MRFKVVSSSNGVRAEAYIHKSDGTVDFISIKITDGYVTQHNIECVLEAYKAINRRYDNEGNEIVHSWTIIDMTEEDPRQ